FPCPERDQQGRYEVHFLLHGLSHTTDEAVQRAANLQPGEPLLAMYDFQNPKDSEAIALRTSETFPKDMYLVGYCPRYLQGDFRTLLKADAQSLDITVARVNPPPAPVQFRVLCRALMRWPAGFKPFNEPEYEPIGSSDGIRMPVVSLPPRR